jgi:hypothetical protein
VATQSGSARCSQPLETGPCKAHMPKFGSANGKCVEFVYGGCQGNDNRFDSQAACEAACSSK